MSLHLILDGDFLKKMFHFDKQKMLVEMKLLGEERKFV